MNTTRGVRAEFIVGSALGCVRTNREEWAPYELKTASGTTLEVKASAYIQAWAQQRPSQVSFDIAPKGPWDAESNEWVGEKRRHADLYVFCLLAHTDQETIDPTQLDQGRFLVLPAATLDQRGRRRSGWDCRR